MPLRNVLILLWATALFWPDGIQAETVVGTIISVHDGDSVTLLASDGRQIKLRLHGIDAPEIRQPYGRESRHSLITLVLGQVITADIRARDQYRRSIAVVTVDGIDINAAQVAAGMAWWYEAYAKSDVELAELESIARKSRLGLWREPDAIPPWSFRSRRGDPRKPGTAAALGGAGT